MCPYKHVLTPIQLDPGSHTYGNKQSILPNFVMLLQPILIGLQLLVGMSAVFYNFIFLSTPSMHVHGPVISRSFSGEIVFFFVVIGQSKSTIDNGKKGEINNTYPRQV